MSEKSTAAKTAGKVWIGVDIGGTKTAVVLCSEPPAILDRIAFPTLPERGPDHPLTRIRQAIHQMIQTNELRPGQIDAIGISCGSPLDRPRSFTCRASPPESAVARSHH
ncbi:MAG: ROK family protein [Acidobacteriaceae bacterium]